MTENKYSRRLGFKLAIKDKWTYTYWFGCEIDKMPYSLKQFLDYLTEMFSYTELFIKIERREK